MKGLFVTNIWMDHAPHMDPVRRDMILASYPVEERKARRYGIPERGTGRVYMKPIDEVTIDWFKIPDMWPVACGLDVGNSDTSATSCIFIAKNPENNNMYVFDEYYCLGHERTFVHAKCILDKGLNLPAAFDYSGNATNDDMVTTRSIYESEGLDKLFNANKAISGGINLVNNKISLGTLRIMANCTNTIREYDQYYFKDGKPVKKNDDCMDALRYCMLKFDEIAMPKYQCTLDYDEEEYYSQQMFNLEQMTGNHDNEEGY